MNRVLMLAGVCILSCASSLWAATLLSEDFSAVSNPSNIVGLLPLGQWHMDGAAEWQAEGWSGEPAGGSVVVVNGSNLVSALQLGWRADNVEVRHVLPATWNIRRDYVFSGDWEKVGDNAGNHLGFHAYLSEFAPTGLVRHVKHLHVNPGNPAVGATSAFSLSVSALELIDAHVSASNHIGVVFVRSEDADLENESKQPNPYSVKNDMFAVDNLVLAESDSTSPGLAGVIMQPVYLSSSGNNAHSGLSPSSPWKTVVALDGRVFGPGAQILFKRGETFPGACTLAGSGTAHEPIVVAAYGTGEKPLLNGVWNQKEIFLLTDNEGIEFRDLKFTNFNTNNTAIKQRYGINLVPPEGAGDLRHLRFIGLDFFAIQGANGSVDPDNDHESRCIVGNTATNDDAAVPSRWNDILVEGCTFADIDGRAVQFIDTCLDITDVKIRGYTNYFPTVGLVFQHNYGTNCYRNLLQIRGTKDALIQYNTMDTTVHGSAFWPFGTDGTLVQFNIFKHLRNSSADGYVCHFDYNCIGTVMQYNYGYDVEGGLIELLVNSENTGTFQEGAIARYNIGVDVGWRNSPNGAGIFITGSVDGAQVYNNTVITLNRPVYKAISYNNWGGAWPINCKIRNNLFHAAGSVSGYNREDKMVVSGNTVERNLYSGNMVPCSADIFPFTGDPEFVNPAGVDASDFKVAYGSAALSRGFVVAGNGGRDFFGYPVAPAGRPTIGFHEYLSDPVIDSDGDAMFDLWESTYGLNPGSAADATGDPDGDLLENLGEFALGGNPANGDDIGHVPASGIVAVGGTNRFAYVYPRRTDAAEIGLEYDLGVTTNLVGGTWVNWAHWIAGVGPEAFGPGFDAVTNYLSLDNAFKQRFIRLEIGQP